MSDKKCYKNIEETFKDSECDCGDQCERLNYRIRMLQRFELFTQIQFWVEDTKFYPLIRQKAFGISDFFGSIGGLVGLFAGISVISLVEFTFHTLEAIKSKVHVTMFRSKVHPMPTINSKCAREIHFNRKHFLYKYFMYVLYFAESGSIHGINHVGNKNKRPMERFFWMAVTLLLMAFCIVLISDLTKDSELTPIDYGIDDKFWSDNDVKLYSLM